jgi:hypothetical protein
MGSGLRNSEMLSSTYIRMNGLNLILSHNYFYIFLKIKDLRNIFITRFWINRRKIIKNLINKIKYHQNFSWIAKIVPFLST